MRLQSTEGIGRLYETCPAQDFVNCMEAKIEDLILTAYDYLEGNKVEGPHDRVEISRRELLILLAHQRITEGNSRPWRSIHACGSGHPRPNRLRTARQKQSWVGNVSGNAVTSLVV